MKVTAPACGLVSSFLPPLRNKLVIGGDQDVPGRACHSADPGPRLGSSHRRPSHAPARATSPNLDHADLHAFYGQAAEVLHDRPGNILLLADRAGRQMVNTTCLRRAAAQCRRAGAAPGQGRYVLSMQYFGERQGGILTRQNIPPDITATIYDSSARIICPDDAQDFRTLLRAQFKAGRLAQTVERALQATGLPSHLLVIEITEQHQLADSEQTRAAMADLRALGVLVAIDDFGTGYSSLSYIGRLRPDELKLDKSLVENVDADAERAGVVVAALAMARSLKLEVVAEGVETEAEKGFLRAHGCDMAQGFLYQRAMPAGEFENCRRDAVAFEIHTPNLWPVIPAKAG